MNNFSLATLLLVSPVMLQAAAIYKWTDEAGNVHYSDNPQTQSAKKIDVRPGPDAEKIEQTKQRRNYKKIVSSGKSGNRKLKEESENNSRR